MQSDNWLASNWKRLLVAVAAVAVVTLLVVWTYMRWQQPLPGAQQAGKRGGGDPTRATPVVAVPAKTADVNVYLNGLGTVLPLKTVTVRSRVDGQLMRVLFREGQVVREGDLLAEIDPRPYQAALTQVEGMMVRDQALLANARIDLDRYRTLLAQDSIAKQLVDTQEALVRQYEGTVKLDQGQVDNARLQLTYSRVTAPIPGLLGLRQVDTGNIVHASDATGIVVITQMQPITALFTIPQDNLPVVLKLLKAGQRVPVEAYDREQKVKLASGALLTVDNQIDPTTVPSAAVQRGAQGIYVYVVKADNTVTLRKVKIGPAEGDATVIESGVDAGEAVVIDGTDRLREGAKVEPTSRDPAAARGGDGTRKKGGGRRKGGDKDGGDTSSSDKSGGDKSGTEKNSIDKSGTDKSGGDKGAGDKGSGKADGDKAADGQKEGGRKRGGWKREKAAE